MSSTITAQNFIENLFFESAVNYSITPTKSEYNAVKILPWHFIYDDISNVGSLNYNLGLGYSFSKTVELKLLYKKSTFRNKTSGLRLNSDKYVDFTSRNEKQRVNSYSLIFTYRKNLPKVSLGFSSGIDYHQANTDDNIFYYGLYPNNLAAYFSVGLSKNIYSNFSIGIRTFSSISFYGWEKYELNTLELDGRFTPVTIGSEVFFRFNFKGSER